MHSCDANISFWRQILDQGYEGSHFRFQLLSMGPAAFVRHLVIALTTASDLFSGKDRALSNSSTSIPASSATHRIQHRIVVFQGLRNHLSEALANVHQAAAALRMPLTLFYEDDRGPGQRRLGEPLGLDLSLRILEAAAGSAGVCSVRLLEVLEGIKEVSAGLRQRTASILLPCPPRADDPAVGSSVTATGGGMNSEQAVCLASAFAQGQLRATTDVLSSRQTRTEEQQDSDKCKRSQGTLLPPVDAALWRVRASASRAGPLVPLPEWLAMPSRLQRYWTTYAIRGAVAAACALYLFRHSSLAGSDDLKR